MKAARIHQYGGPEILVYEDAPQPEPAAGQLLVRVRAAGINPVDYQTRTGKGGMASRFGDNPFPLILGWDVAGVVADDGGSSTFPNGTAVYGMIGFPDVGAAYAEYAVADPSAIATMPTNISFEEAASLPLAALTAWQALIDGGDIQAGQRVLIHGAAGGVGHLAVQIAKWRGAFVIGTASPNNADYLRDIGVDAVIDYTSQPFDAAGKVDVVLDTVGGDTLTRSFDVIRPGGKLLSLTAEPDKGRAQALNIDSLRVFVVQNGEQLGQIAALVEQGHIKPTLAKTFPLSEAAEAHRLLETRHVRGKVVLTVSS